MRICVLKISFAVIFKRIERYKYINCYLVFYIFFSVCVSYYIMFVNQSEFGNYKENVNLASGKALIHKSQKGLTSRSLNSFNDTTNVIQNKKSISEINAGSCNFFLTQDKENSKPKVIVPDIEVEPCAEEDPWSDIEEMHVYIEPEDDYEDILPKCERIQKQDIDSLFFNYTSANLSEVTVDRLPSPLPEFKNLDIPEFTLLIPDINTSLYDDTELDYIPLLK